MPTPTIVRFATHPALALLLALAAPSSRADTTSIDGMRCARGLVSLRDSKVDLLGRCGEPTFQEERFEERVVRTSTAASTERRPPSASSMRTPMVERRSLVRVERWTYNFGPQRFLHFVTLEDGAIVRLESGAYGFERPVAAPTPDVPRAQCEPQALRTGLQSAEILARCGAPASIDRRLEALDVDGVPTQTTAVETWVYDFGPATFTRRLTLRNGALSAIESGPYGYAR